MEVVCFPNVKKGIDMESKREKRFKKKREKKVELKYILY